MVYPPEKEEAGSLLPFLFQTNWSQSLGGIYISENPGVNGSEETLFRVSGRGLSISCGVQLMVLQSRLLGSLLSVCTPGKEQPEGEYENPERKDQRLPRQFVSCRETLDTRYDERGEDRFPD